MSQADVKRFIDDLKAKPTLLAGLKGKATGIAAIAAYAAANGYAITADEVRTYIRSQSLRSLSDAHIDRIAGGKGTPFNPAGPVGGTRNDVGMAPIEAVATIVMVGPVVVQAAQAQGVVVVTTTVA